MNNTPLEQEAVSAAEDRAALDAVLATLSPYQVQQMASAMLALGAMTGRSAQ
jgi:hypothetical protein